METRASGQVKWGGQLWIVALVAIALTVAILLVVFPRSLAYIAPTPTPPSWTRAPGLFEIPTISPVPEFTPTPAETPTP